MADTYSCSHIKSNSGELRLKEPYSYVIGSYHNYSHVRSRNPEKVNCLVRPVEVDKWPILTVAAILSRIVLSGG